MGSFDVLQTRIGSLNPVGTGSTPGPSLFPPLRRSGTRLERVPTRFMENLHVLPARVGPSNQSASSFPARSAAPSGGEGDRRP